MTDNPWPAHSLCLTIAPCFIMCAYQPKDEMADEESEINMLNRVIFLQKRIGEMKIVLDSPAQFLLKQYEKISKNKKNNSLVRHVFKDWLKCVRILKYEERGVEDVRVNEDDINKNREKLENILICSTQSADCFIKCVTICHCSKDRRLLTNKASLIKKVNVDREFDIKVFDHEDAEKSFPLSIFDIPKNPEKIQEVLIEKYLPSIEKRIRERRDYNVYYSAKDKPQREPYITEHIFNELDERIEHANMRCIHQAGTGAGTTDAIVSGSGHEVVIEAKKALSKLALEDGVKELCANLRGRRTDYGIYLIFYFDCAQTESIEESKEQVKQITEEQVKQIKQKYPSESQDYKIEIFCIDFSKRPSASKL